MHKIFSITRLKSFGRILALTVFAIMIIGCSKQPLLTHDPQDPYEGFNRRVNSFNQVVDKVTLKPITVAYTHVIPSPLRHMIHQFFNNLNEIPTIINDLLQAKGTYAASDTWRLLINSTVGIGGLFDPASRTGLPPHDNNFGLTLYNWGAKESPYMVMTFLGPSTYRDSFASIFDLFIFSAWPHLSNIQPEAIYYSLLATWVVDQRAQILPADILIDQAFDPYVFMRNAFFQIRAKQIADNQMPYCEFLEKFQKQQQLAHQSTTHTDENEQL